jgi:hypothetical protein
MIDEPSGCLSILFDPPRASPRQWLVGLGTMTLLMAALYFIFSALGL